MARCLDSRRSQEHHRPAVRRLNLSTIGAVCAILTTASFVAVGVLLSTSGVQDLIPETGADGLEWIADVDDASGALFVGAWLIILTTLVGSVALVGFWSTQTTNLWMLWWGIGSFCSGWVAPLELMPSWLQQVARVLPFWATLGFPVELLSGRLAPGEVATGFGVGLAWTAAFAGLYVLGWRHGIRRFQAVAG